MSCVVTALEGRTALVTGASRGIGRATALALARAGASVAVGFRRDEDSANAVKHEIEALGRTCVAVAADVSHSDEVARLAADEVAQVVVMLACNAYITGQTINVNGGIYMS